MGRPARFTREELQAKALSIVDEHGLEALSMRSLAQALGTGAMTLYNYVGTREELDVLVVEAVAGKATWVVPQGCRWEEELVVIARALWSAVRAHPHAVPLILTCRSRSPTTLRVAEALLASIARAGLQGDGLLIAFRSVMALIIGLAQGELAGPLALRAGESAEETIKRLRSLPADCFPCLREAADAAASSNPDHEFNESLRLLIVGIKNAKAR